MVPEVNSWVLLDVSCECFLESSNIVSIRCENTITFEFGYCVLICFYFMLKYEFQILSRDNWDFFIGEGSMWAVFS